MLHTYVYKNQNEVLLLLCFYYYALFKSKAESEKPNGRLYIYLNYILDQKQFR